MPSVDPALEIEPRDLVVALEGGEPVQVLDVRAPERLGAGVVEPVGSGRFFNIRGSELLSSSDPETLGLSRQHPLAVVCGRGHDSLVVASFLRRIGFRAMSLRGGIFAWMRLVVPRELPPPAGFDRLVQIDRVGKGALGYVLAGDGEAILVDIPREWEPLLAIVEEAGARVRAVADTHVHADYISGGPAAAAALGVPYHLHPADNVFPFDGTPGALEITPLRHGQTLEVGGGCVTVWHAPGHTEGHVCFLASDGGPPGASGAIPTAAFTGDFVFIESVGRPDLAGRADEWCGDLWTSVCRARDAWPPEMLVYPAHCASDAERAPDRSVGRAFGRLLAENEPLGIRDEAAFRAWVEDRLSEPPIAYRTIKAINVGLARARGEEADVLEAGKNECAVGRT